MKVRIDYDTDTVEDCARALRRWIDGVEAGEMEVDELLGGLRSIVLELEDELRNVTRAAT